MEEHELLVVKWVNDLLGGRFVVPPHVVMETIVLIALIVFFGILRTRYSVEAPGRLQQALELFVEFLNEQLESNIGHEGHKYLAIVGTFAIFGGLLQAFIFCTLTMVYLGGAVATEEHH